MMYCTSAGRRKLAEVGQPCNSSSSIWWVARAPRLIVWVGWSRASYSSVTVSCMGSCTRSQAASMISGFSLPVVSVSKIIAVITVLFLLSVAVLCTHLFFCATKFLFWQFCHRHFCYRHFYHRHFAWRFYLLRFLFFTTK